MEHNGSGQVSDGTKGLRVESARGASVLVVQGNLFVRDWVGGVYEESRRRYGKYAGNRIWYG